MKVGCLSPAAWVIAALLSVSLAAGAEPSTSDGKLPSGLEIAGQLNARDDGEIVVQTVTMELIDRKGNRRARETRTYRKYYGKERRTVMFFESPKNVKGTAFLTYDYPDADADDDQWLYLPALRKVRRISASDRGNYFMGTDLTYEDIKLGTKVSIEDYTWQTLGVEVVDGVRCYVIEGTPVSRDVALELGYGRLESRVDPEIWMPRRVDAWDVNGNPLKIVEFHDLRPVDGIWTAFRTEVRNHKTGHRTIFTLSDVQYNTGVRDDLFTQRALQRGP